MINNVTILDLETTGLDTEKDEVAEIGTILYSVRHQTVLQQYSTVIPVKENPQESINRISVEASQSLLEYDGELGRSDIFVPVFGMVQKSEYLIAHNANFDKHWQLVSHFDKHWLCTLNDFVWPHNHKPSNLITTALNHGIGVTKAHRALSDCQLIAELFDRTEDLQGLFERAIARSNEPIKKVVLNLDFDEKSLAKEKGFHWDFENQVWFKEFKESDFLAQKEDLRELLERSEEPVITVTASISFSEKELVKAAKFRWNPEAKIWEKKLKKSDFLSQKNSWNFEYYTLGI